MNALREYRKSRGVTQRALAEATGILLSRINRIEKGHVLPTQRQAVATAAYFSRLVEDLFPDGFSTSRRGRRPRKDPPYLPDPPQHWPARKTTVTACKKCGATLYISGCLTIANPLQCPQCGKEILAIE